MKTSLEYTIGTLVLIATGQANERLVFIPEWYAKEQKIKGTIYVKTKKHARRILDRLHTRYNDFRVNGVNGSVELLQEVWRLDEAMQIIGMGTAWTVK